MFKKKYPILILLPLFLFSSCSGIKSEINTVWEGVKNTADIQKKWKGQAWDFQVHKSVQACWEKTCALQEYLEEQEQEWKLNLSKTEYFQKRFWILLDRYKEKDVLVKTEEFQKFVNDFNAEYFPCEWKVEVCNKKSSYTYDEQNFIWYIFLPRMVAIEFQGKRDGSDSDTESITQSIRRKYYATYDEKETMIQIWKDRLTAKAKKIDISSIDTKKLKEDREYFNRIVLASESGIYDQIITNLLSPIPWQEKWELLDTTAFGVNLFFSKMGELWIDKKYFYDFIGTSDENFRKLDAKLMSIDKTYGLSQKMPSDRYLRHDEIANYIFANLWDFNAKWDFNKDVLDAKHYLLLQFSFPNPDLYNMPERASRFNSINNFMGENLLKYSKYMKNNVEKF